MLGLIERFTGRKDKSTVRLEITEINPPTPTSLANFLEGHSVARASVLLRTKEDGEEERIVEIKGDTLIGMSRGITGELMPQTKTDMHIATEDDVTKTKEWLEEYNAWRSSKQYNLDSFLNRRHINPILVSLRMISVENALEKQAPQRVLFET